LSSSLKYSKIFLAVQAQTSFNHSSSSIEYLNSKKSSFDLKTFDNSFAPCLPIQEIFKETKKLTISWFLALLIAVNKLFTDFSLYHGNGKISCFLSSKEKISFKFFINHKS
jgi:ferritin